jgi:hypothetical protein
MLVHRYHPAAFTVQMDGLGVLAVIRFDKAFLRQRLQQ